VADDRDPYWVYGAQQDSGAVSVETRSTQGSITYLRGWDTICAGGESGYVAVDPADSDVLYGGTVSKCRQSTNVGEQISPMLGYAELGPFRHTWTLPLVFSQAVRTRCISATNTSGKRPMEAGAGSGSVRI